MFKTLRDYAGHHFAHNNGGAYTAKLRRSEVVDLGRIGLPPPQCECGVIPLYYRPNAMSVSCLARTCKN